MTVTTKQSPAPAETGTGLRDTTRAEKRNAQGQDTTLTTVGPSVIHWQTAGPLPLAHRDAPPVPKKLSKREQERAERIAACQVRPIGPGAWEVDSASTPGTTHEVHAVNGSLVCTCPATRVCHHVTKVAPLWQEQQRRQARYDRAYAQEFVAPSIVSVERLAVLRQESEYGDGWLSGGVS